MSDAPTPPAMPDDEVARALGAARSGEPGAAEELARLVYADLRELARVRIARLGPGQTLQATALVHEAYLHLVGGGDPGWESRAHFFGAAARAMRNVLADHLQKKGSLKRGGHLRRVGEDTVCALSSEGPNDDVLALEEALQELERLYPRKAEGVTLRIFGGLTALEIAELQGVHEATVERDWRFAKAWLGGRLRDPEGDA